MVPIDASSTVWTLIYNSKLANKIAKIVAFVVKIRFTSTALYVKVNKIDQLSTWQIEYSIDPINPNCFSY